MTRCAHFIRVMAILLLAQTGHALEIADFANKGLGQFQHKSFVGYTQYKLVEHEGEQVIRAATKHKASALYRHMDIDLTATPYMNWRWRVDNIYDISNQQDKNGDDFPARIYVIVKYGSMPWHTRALNYIWSNQVESEPFWPNPYTEQAIMIPVRSGADGLGQWHSERVNVAADYLRIFGEPIAKAKAVAIMSDADNAGGKAVAFYSVIKFTD